MTIGMDETASDGHIVTRYSDDGVALRWQMDATRTKAGLLTEHHLGPITPGDASFFGSNGVSRCNDPTAWRVAAAIVRFALITATDRDFYMTYLLVEHRAGLARRGQRSATTSRLLCDPPNGGA